MSKWLPLSLIVLSTIAVGADSPEFASDVQPIFTKYCTGCHNADEANGKFALHDFKSLMKGGEHGAVLVPGKIDESRLVKLLERTAEPAMPPEGEPAPTAAEVEVLKAWIAAGAKAPVGDGVPALMVPSIEPIGAVRRPVHAVSWSPDASTIAVGRYQSVEILGGDLEPLSTIGGLIGPVNVVGFLGDDQVYAGGGESGLTGEIGVWDLWTGQPIWKAVAHRDSVTSAAISSDGSLLATGSYDQSIVVWDAMTGERKAELTGHNGPVFGLAFHPTKPILASASGDRTIKLWDALAGTRLDTLTEPTKEQFTIAFSPDGRYLAAGGADSRIRVWSITDGRAGTNDILFSHFAHEGPILALAYSPDGRFLITAAEDQAVKLWDAPSLTQIQDPVRQPDWVSAIAAHPAGERIALGRLDGTLALLALPSVVVPKNAERHETEPVAAIKPLAVSRDESEPEPVEEQEPNDTPEIASPLSLPGVVTGVLNPSGDRDFDSDCFRFVASVGETWIFETNAARSGSPADTKIDILNAEGTPVERFRLRATRDSAINFRGFNAVNPGLRVDYWEEMELNQFMYLSGEVCRIFRMPQGPDSDMQLYSVGGQRRSYFDTTPVAHALHEPVYIVEPLPAGEDPSPNGLPVFSLPFENDDDSERKLGRDSKLTFTVPATGEYIVRVRDARRFGGSDYKYTLTARRPQPGFEVSIAEADRTVPAGSGQRLTLKANRIDGFEGPIVVEFSNVPEGFAVSTPVVIEEGHSEAKAVLSAAVDAETPSEEAIKSLVISSKASIGGRTVSKPVAPPAKIAVGEKPKLTVSLLPTGGADEIVIRPGEPVIATLRIERNGYDGEIKFDVENLPHGVIVDHIGLNGVLIRANETERQIELTCAKWVPPTSRLIFAVGKGQGDQASRPVLLRVEHDEELARAGG